MAGYGEFSGGRVFPYIDYNNPQTRNGERNPQNDYNPSRNLSEMQQYRDPNLHPESNDDLSDDDSFKQYVITGVSLASLITENLLSHPFIVLRRQCQVHVNSKQSHIFPITLAPVVFQLHRRQEFTTLWKGIGSACIVKGMTLAADDIISKITTWPKDIDQCNSIESFSKHIFLKCISLAVATPFYSASLVETVQSEVASDKPGILDVFKNGAERLLAWGTPQTGRMLPIWAIVAPTVAFGISKYLFSTLIRKMVFRVMQFKERSRMGKLKSYYPNHSMDRNELSPDNLALSDMQMKSAIVAMMVGEIVFYPAETILHRLHMQGTRTIIDNLDTGMSVQPILTGYEGFFDCYQASIAKDGFASLYKGFGALVLQLAAHIAVLKLTRWIMTEIGELLKPAQKPSTLKASPSQSSLYTSQRYLIN